MGGRCGLEAKTASVDTATASFDAPKEIPKSVAPNEAPKDTTRLVIDESNVNKDANKANELTPVQQLAAARQRSTTSGSRSTNYSTLDTRASSDRSYKVVIKALDEDDPLFAVSQEVHTYLYGPFCTAFPRVFCLSCLVYLSRKLFRDQDYTTVSDVTFSGHKRIGF